MLLARIFTIVFLVFAFAQPYMPVENETQTESEEVIGIYIDNSFSMNALSEKGQLIELARIKAAEIAQSYPTGTRFRLFTNDMNPGHQQLLNKEQIFNIITTIQSSPSVVPVSLVNNRFNVLNKTDDTNGTLFLISDFQRAISDLGNFTENSSRLWFVPLMPNQVNNLYIDSCWVEVPVHGLNQEETVYVKIKNSSNEDYQNLPLNLYLNDSLKSVTSFNISEQEEIITTLHYKNVHPGIQKGRIEITDYPFTHDNTWYISYFVEPRLKAVAIFEDNTSSREGLKYLNALFQDDDYVTLENMNVRNMQISKLQENNTIFLINPSNFSSGLVNELLATVKAGASVVLFPSETISPEINNELLTAFGAGTISELDTTAMEISGIDFENRFFADVFSERKENAFNPLINSHFKFNQSIRTEETPLLWFQNGDKALSVLPFGDGKVWIFSFPLDSKNNSFANNILFVPSIYNIVLNSLPDQKLSHTIGDGESWLLPQTLNTNRESPLELHNPETGNRFIPEMMVSPRGTQIGFQNMIESAGHYLVEQEQVTLAALAFNYNRKESDFRYLSVDEINQQIKINNLQNATVFDNVSTNFKEELKDIQRGRQLWKWCILLSLLFIFTEALIARLWK